MGFAGDVLKGIDAERRSGGLGGLAGLRGLEDSPPTIDEVRAADPGEGIISSVLLAPVRAAQGLLDGIGYVDATTRAGVGRLLGVQGSGEETPLGPAPSGRELLGLGPGTKGTFESGDIAGTAADVLLSPLNLLGVGSLSKAGQAAKALEEVSAAQKAYALTKQAKKAAELEPRIAEVLAEHGTLGTKSTLGLQIPGLTASAIRDAELADPASKLRYGKTLAEQGRLGQRSLLSIGFPGLGETSLLPSAANEAALGAIGKTYERFAGAPLRPLYNAVFRPAGKLGELGYDTLVDTTVREGERAGVRLGEGQALRTTEALDKAAVSDADVLRVRDVLQRGAQKFEQDYVTQFGKPPKESVLRKLTLDRGIEGGDAARKLTMLGLEHTGVRTKLAGEIADVQAELAGREARINAQIAQRKAAGQKLGWLPARIAQVRKAAARKILPLAAKADIGDQLASALPPDIAAEVGRLAAVTGKELSKDRGAGVRVSALTDPLLGYVHRAVSPGGRELADNLLKLGVQEDEGLRVVRQFTSEADFTKRRSEALRGLGVLQANDWLAEQARKNATAALANAAATPEQRRAASKVIELLDRGARFFDENPEISVLRRLASGGEARGAARLMAGVVEMFAVPKDLAGPGSLSVPEFLERAGLGKLRGVVLPESKGGIERALQSTGLADLHVPQKYAQAALQSRRVLENPQELRGMLRLFTQVNSLARIGATLPRPGYYARNLMGNVYNMWLAGFRDVGKMGRAYNLLRREASDTLDKAERRLLARAVDLGAIDSGAAAEVRQLTNEAGLLGDKTRLAKIGSGVVDVGLAVNRRIENTSKLALYLDGKAKGLSDTEAAQRVRKYLFDYTDISPVERNYLRRLAFFYTFQRFNLPLQIESILKNPQTFRAYGLATGRIGESVQRELLPQWQANQGLISTGQDENGQRSFVSLGLPPEDIFRYSDEGGGLRRVGQKVLSNLVPALRVPLEGITGVALGTGLPLRGRPADQAIAAALPPQLAQDASLLLGAETAGPTAGVSGVLRRIGESGGEADKLARIGISFATGISPVVTDDAKAQRQQRREAAQQIKDRMDSAGVPDDDPRRKAVNRALRTK